MNWRVILGLILLLVGIRVMFVALNASGNQAWMAGVGGAIWITLGTFFIVKSMVKKDIN